MRLGSLAVYTLLAVTVASQLASAGPISGFAQTNLVSNIPGLAAVTDPQLMNPWGTSFSATSPFWVSDNGAGFATLYNGSGTKQGLVVTIPGAGGAQGAPTGQVFSGTAAFNSDLFIFAGEDGLITGWRGSLGTTAETLFNNSGALAVYKGLAISTIGTNSYLYAANFRSGLIDVFPSTGAPALTGNFVDPNIPAGFAPFNIQNIGGQLYVTYAMQDAAKHDDVPGPGNGFVSVFNTNGTFVKRLVSDGSLNSPWGIALAPAGFGGLGGDFLIGNFGDGSINVYTQAGAFVGTLADLKGNLLVNDGLWALTFGNGGNGGSPGSLYLTAGLNGEMDGLFGRIDAVPEPGTLGLLLAGFGIMAARRARRRVR
jgi:uncharacterized protein (TIGR03118 family)